MAEADRRARGALWWFKLLVLMVAAGGLGWLAARYAAVRMLRTQPGFAERISPGDVDTVYRAAAMELIRSRGQLPPETFARIGEAAKRDPLGAEPFMFFGLRAVQQRDLPRAERLLTEARRRNARLEMARLALLATYLETGRIAEGSAEIAVFVRLVPRAAGLIVPELSRLAARPQTADAVVAAIGDDPLMADVLTRLAQQNVSADHLIRLAARQPRTRTFENGGWQSVLLERLIRGGDIARAHQLWKQFVGVSGTGSLIYDPRFEASSGPLPFNWSLSTSGAAGVAEPAAGGALEVEYYGRASAPLASQLLVLSPGRYRLEMRAEGSATGQGSRLEWQITCNGSNASLGTIPLRNVTYNPRTLAADFTVPATGCAGQWLRLQGIAAEFPATQSVKISELALRRAGGGQ